MAKAYFTILAACTMALVAGKKTLRKNNRQGVVGDLTYVEASSIDRAKQQANQHLTPAEPSASSTSGSVEKGPSTYGSNLTPAEPSTGPTSGLEMCTNPDGSVEKVPMGTCVESVPGAGDAPGSDDVCTEYHATEANNVEGIGACPVTIDHEEVPNPLKPAHTVAVTATCCTATAAESALTGEELTLPPSEWPTTCVQKKNLVPDEVCVPGEDDAATIF